MTATTVAFVAACGVDDGASDQSAKFDRIIDEFTAQNPNIEIELLSAPYASAKQQLLTGAASKTLPDALARSTGEPVLGMATRSGTT
ncbi:hypothetical protein O7621_06455 [Solwaraspora sp. WMMD937]|uniref:hypothetical protein n=1 Tax=Solwaraspora sp. WMMD937 TaxID=3016090 RepID=UPI00249AB739|nr:hypothetical protein [Solwaraspora sp. WMMD937]WFE22962.1 hypothetical protein O7621_06455 [Solwaraspora sp. WMMD937]